MGHKYEIYIKINEREKKIIIGDTGIGMNEKDLIKYLGTIAHSGTQRFLKNLSNDKKDTQLIGQFGVGFYSSFIVSDMVTVISKKAGEKKTFIWKSDGKGEYTIIESDKDISQGTQVILKIKSAEQRYLNKLCLKNIINTYSDYLPFPVKFIDEKDNDEIINKVSALWMRN